MESSSAEALETNLADINHLPSSARTTAMTIGATPVDFDDGDDRNRVFQRLVTTDDDVAGLVAYSIYKQNKLDWLLAFEKRLSRPPEEAEIAAYIIGESTPRRLATYRHLAVSTLRGSGLNAGDNADRPSALPPYARSSAGFAEASTVVSYLIFAVVVLIALFLAARFGLVLK
ncbi:MAG: hypothetical protein HYS06_07695 [Methylocystis sp.]|nr:hypothetical protein [Methylocystis sp.]